MRFLKLFSGISQRTVFDFKILRSKSTETLSFSKIGVLSGMKAHNLNMDGSCKVLQGSVGKVQCQGLSTEGVQHLLTLDTPSNLLGVKEPEKPKGGLRHLLGSIAPMGR